MTGEGKKDLLRQIPRVKLWLVLILTLIFTIVLLTAAHLTHSLTLRVEAYHALYNLLSLSGCLITMKLCSRPQSLHNTFGWARVEVLSMLTTLLFLSSLCFSVAIESVQTALHAQHQDAMHHPLSIMALGGIGLCLNALVFVLIGGYTHHQGCFLEMRDSGSVWVGRQVTQEAVQAGRRMLSSNDLATATPHPAAQVIRELLRDAVGLVLVEICAAVVYQDDGGTVALYIDPALAVTSAALLMWLSYPYGKECGQILLQTIPGHIDVETFQNRVLEQFPDIVNVHHLHIWTFTPRKVVATAHVVFSNPRVYLATQPALMQFFNDEGITHVTIQPECMPAKACTMEDFPVCLLRCQKKGCRERECCLYASHPHLTSVTASSGPSTSGHKCVEEEDECKMELLSCSCQEHDSSRDEAYDSGRSPQVSEGKYTPKDVTGSDVGIREGLGWEGKSMESVCASGEKEGRGGNMERECGEMEGKRDGDEEEEEGGEERTYTEKKEEKIENTSVYVSMVGREIEYSSTNTDTTTNATTSTTNTTNSTTSTTNTTYSSLNAGTFDRLLSKSDTKLDRDTSNKALSRSIAHSFGEISSGSNTNNAQHSCNKGQHSCTTGNIDQHTHNQEQHARNTNSPDQHAHSTETEDITDTQATESTKLLFSAFDRNYKSF